MPLKENPTIIPRYFFLTKGILLNFRYWSRVAGLILFLASALLTARFESALAATIDASAKTQASELSVYDADIFRKWKAELRDEARERRIPGWLFDEAVGTAEPLLEVLERDRKQPEFRLTFGHYLNRVVTDARVSKARKLLKKHAPLLKEIERRFGVQPRFLVAFWGLESSFGEHTGTFPVLPALMTLAYDTRRSAFFREQFFHALQIVHQGHIAIKDMSGSWAGAMGQLQFIPSTFSGYAVDFDRDGRRDIWASLPDVFASAANLLSKTGWENERTWGREVLLPEDFSWELAGLSIKKKLSVWQALGVRRADGRNLPEVDIEASIVLPAGHRGPAFAVYENFETIMTWNRSLFYALAVGHLSDRIAGGPGLLTKTDYEERPLSLDDVKEIQETLNALGFDVGDVDGLAGRRTREALRAFQRRNGLPSDGYPNQEILKALQQAKIKSNL